MTVLLDSVAAVLVASDHPLKAEDITRRLLQKGLWKSSGKTPAATVHAAIAVDIKNQGDASRFIRTAPATFALRHPHQTGAAPPPEPPGDTVKAAAPLSFTDAAEKVLREAGDGKPMHYRKITKIALERGWLQSAGHTPEATLYSQIYTETHRRKKRGEQARFYQLKGGLIGLTEWMPKGLRAQIAEYNHTVKARLQEHLLNLEPAQFEALIGRLRSTMGFVEVMITPLSNDGGIDVRALLVVGDTVRIRMAVQAKKWQNNVQAPDVQRVRGSLGAHDQGMIITTTGFSPGAVTEAARPDAAPVALVGGEQLVTLLVENGIGVQADTESVLTFSPDSLIDPTS